MFLVEVTCGGVVQNNLTYFMSPRFPELWTGEQNCSVQIEKTHAGIMQLRIDFVHFTIVSNLWRLWKLPACASYNKKDQVKIIRHWTLWRILRYAAFLTQVIFYGPKCTLHIYPCKFNTFIFKICRANQIVLPGHATKMPWCWEKEQPTLPSVVKTMDNTASA